MKQLLIRHGRVLALCISSLLLLIVITACSGVSTNTGTVSITGAIQSVTAANHSVTLNVSGQSYTINGLTDTEVAQLQNQVGKTYQITATQNADGSYTIATGTNPVASTDGTSGITATANPSNGTNEPGSISYIGTAQNVSPNSITVSMPGGDSLTMSITPTTDRSEIGTGLPQNGQQIKVKATTLNDGTFTATSLDLVKPEDAANPTKINTVDFNGVTTSAVGADNVVHFRVGSKDFSYTANPTTTQIKGFTSLQAIAANTPIKIDVLFNGSNGTVLKVDNGND
jgi:Domain of unknown function (DUF5666)